MTNDRQTTFSVMVPVQITVTQGIQLSRMFGRLKEAGATLWSTDGYEYKIRTDKLRLRDLRAAYRSALEQVSK